MSADVAGAPDPFAAAGELREVYLAVDWAASPVGPPEGWSPSLRTALALVFATSLPRRCCGASPVDGPDGRVEGVLDLTIETTRSVVDARRAHLLSRLADLPLVLTDPAELAGLALPLLRTDREDLPLVELLVPGEPARALEPALAAAPPEAGVQTVVVAGPAGRTAWLPLGGLGDTGRRPLLEVVLSPALAEDEHYLGFLRQVAAAMGNAVAVASAARDARARIDLQAEQVHRLVGLVEALRALLDADGPEQLERVVSDHAARLIGARWARPVLTDDDAPAPAAGPASWTTGAGAGSAPVPRTAPPASSGWRWWAATSARSTWPGTAAGPRTT